MTTRLIRDDLDAPRLQPVRIGLRQSSDRFPEGSRWHGGIAYRPLTATVPLAADSTYDPCDTFTISRDRTGPVEWNPWGIDLGEECLAGSTDTDEEAERARIRLEAQTDYMLERTFWTGIVGSSDFTGLGWPNRPLADPASDELTITGPVGIVTAFSRAVQYLADTIGALRGMIHIPPKLAPFTAFYGVTIREGFQVLTRVNDHVVVVGSGYDGSSPDGEPDDDSSTWIYVTSMVRADASPVRSLADLNRGDNDIESAASRLVLAEWDLQAHGAAQVCIPDPGPSCVSVPS